MSRGGQASKVVGGAEPDKLRLVWIQREPIGRHPEVQISRESINAANKSELVEDHIHKYGVSIVEHRDQKVDHG